MENYRREQLLSFAYGMGITIRSDDDLQQFEFELVVKGDLPESVLADPIPNDIRKILDLVTKMDKSINVEPSAYQSKKELIKAKAVADIKKDTIINKRK